VSFQIIVVIVLVLPKQTEIEDEDEFCRKTDNRPEPPATWQKYAHFPPLSRLHLVEMQVLLNAGRVSIEYLAAQLRLYFNSMLL
jgi:hypothetical protein